MATHDNPTGSVAAGGADPRPDEGLGENEQVLTFPLPGGRILIVRVGVSSTHPRVPPPRPFRLHTLLSIDEEHVLGVNVSIDQIFQSHPEVSGPQPGLNP